MQTYFTVIMVSLVLVAILLLVILATGLWHGNIYGLVAGIAIGALSYGIGYVNGEDAEAASRYNR
jgi:membrane protein required for beta-lactamase induction